MRAEGDGRKPPLPAGEIMEAEDPYRPMSTAPKDGSFLWLREEGRAPQEWYWYQTRVFKNGHWMPTAWWKPRLGPSALREFKPTGWRRSSEGPA